MSAYWLGPSCRLKLSVPRYNLATLLMQNSQPCLVSIATTTFDEHCRRFSIIRGIEDRAHEVIYLQSLDFQDDLRIQQTTQRWNLQFANHQLNFREHHHQQPTQCLAIIQIYRCVRKQVEHLSDDSAHLVMENVSCAISSAEINIDILLGPICDSYVRPAVVCRICEWLSMSEQLYCSAWLNFWPRMPYWLCSGDECSFGNYANKCIICGGDGISDARKSLLIFSLVGCWHVQIIVNHAQNSSETEKVVQKSSTLALRGRICSTRRKDSGRKTTDSDPNISDCFMQECTSRHQQASRIISIIENRFDEFLVRPRY